MTKFSYILPCMFSQNKDLFDKRKKFKIIFVMRTPKSVVRGGDLNFGKNFHRGIRNNFFLESQEVSGMGN